jgi:hypothetical protein
MRNQERLCFGIEISGTSRNAGNANLHSLSWDMIFNKRTNQEGVPNTTSTEQGKYTLLCGGPYCRAPQIPVVNPRSAPPGTPDPPCGITHMVAVSATVNANWNPNGAPKVGNYPGYKWSDVKNGFAQALWGAIQKGSKGYKTYESLVVVVNSAKGREESCGKPILSGGGNLIPSQIQITA